MHITVILLVIIDERLDDAAWFLRGRGAIEIDQRMLVDGFSKDWKMVTSNISAPINGMQLKTLEEAQTPQAGENL